MAPWVFVNICLGNGLLPYGSKPLPEPMVTYEQYGAENNCQLVILKMLIMKLCLKIKRLKLEQHLTGDNDLN